MRIARAHARTRTSKVKGSLGSSGQVVKAHFRRSRILTAVVNGPTVSIGVTTP